MKWDGIEIDVIFNLTGKSAIEKPSAYLPQIIIKVFKILRVLSDYQKLDIYRKLAVVY